jgi:hypothetical protein
MFKHDEEMYDVFEQKLEGFCIDLITELSRLIGFKYRIKLVDDGKYGSVKPDGSWNGMVGELLDGVRE